jgi:hypothetical protein
MHFLELMRKFPKVMVDNKPANLFLFDTPGTEGKYFGGIITTWVF